ncbi:MAG: PAC2 family protein [Methanomassiliicoccales archaeon]
MPVSPMSEGEIFIHEYDDVDLKDGMVVVGFPSVGLVSSIASNYIVRTMKLARRAAIISKHFPPFTIIHDGIPLAPGPHLRRSSRMRRGGKVREACRDHL